MSGCGCPPSVPLARTRPRLLPGESEGGRRGLQRLRAGASVCSPARRGSPGAHGVPGPSLGALETAVRAASSLAELCAPREGTQWALCPHDEEERAWAGVAELCEACWPLRGRWCPVWHLNLPMGFKAQEWGFEPEPRLGFSELFYWAPSCLLLKPLTPLALTPARR